MRVVLLTNGQSNQVALANKISAQVEVAAVVVSKNITRRKRPISEQAKLFRNRVLARTVGRELTRAWFDMLARYDLLYEQFPTDKIVRVDNINDPATITAIDKYEADVVVVSGTNLVGKRVIEASQRRGGIVNLHTGISPYVKGGPNCTNWCLAKNWFYLIGNTVMWLDAGIDTGNVIATERTPLDGSETLTDLHWKVMEHAHDLYAGAIFQIAQGKEMPSVPQDSIAGGTHFNSVDWKAGEMLSALSNFRRNFKGYFSSSDLRESESEGIRLFPLVR